MAETHDFAPFLMSFYLFNWITIFAIICGAIAKIVAMQHELRKRFEMIRQGMNPDGGKGRQLEL